MTEEKLHFVCGLPRSGTTWLARTLASHPQIALFGETDFWGRDYVQPDADGTYGPREITRVAAIQQRKEWRDTTGDEHSLAALPYGAYGRVVTEVLKRRSREHPATLFSAIARGVASLQGKSIAVEKTPGHLLFLDRIWAAFPSARVVALMREPHGFAASLIYRGDSNAWRAFAYHPAIITFWWRAYARSLIAHAPHGGQLLIIDQRQLEADPQSAAVSAVRHFGLDPEGMLVDARPVNSSFLGRKRHASPRTTGYWLRRLASAECRTLYPELRHEAVSGWSVFASWLTLLPAALLFVLFFRPTTAGLLRHILAFVQAGRSGAPAGKL